MFLVVFAVFLALASSTPNPKPGPFYYMEPGAVSFDTYELFLDEQKNVINRIEDGEKIASGVAAKKGNYPELCYLSIEFYQKQQTCGCYVHDEYHVITSARCVIDCSEDLATNITVTLLSTTGKDSIRFASEITVPDGTNGEGLLPVYERDKDGLDTDYHAISGSNIAVIKVNNKIKLDSTRKKVASAKPITSEADYETWLAAHSAGQSWKTIACGVGVIDNRGTRSKGVVCTDVNIVPKEECKDTLDNVDSMPYTVADGLACLVWPEKQNNVCVGDFGGPVFVVKVKDAKGTIDASTQEVACVLIGSPNVRENSQCLDGHANLCQWMPGPAGGMNARSWIEAIIREGL